MTVLYGSSVADTTLTTACKMSTASGGTETSKTTTISGASNYGEIWSKGNASLSSVASIPTTPTGNGWIFQPGAGTFAAGNWSASNALAARFTGTLSGDITLRFSKYNGGVYTSIGQIVLTSPVMSPTRAVFSFAATAMPAVTTTASDFIYIDQWLHDSTGAASDNPVVYESTSATAGVVNDMQITTSTFTPASSGNTIVGLARARYLEAISQVGVSRAKFTESIGSFGRSRSKFTISIGSKQASRSKFLVSIAQKGISRSQFVISKASKGLSRSNYLLSKASKGLARSKFTVAIAQKPGARSKFLLSIGQKGQARSKFYLSTVIKGLAESTFKVFAAGHAITAYIRSRYKVSIRQSQAQRSRFLVRFSQTGIARSLFKVAAKTSAQARSRFLVRFGITGIARSHYLLSIRQAVLARSRFITRLALMVRARSKFLVQGILITLPIKSITHAVYQVLSAAWNVLSALGLVSSHAPALTITHQELAMPAPNSTILPTITVTDISGALVSNASAVSLVVYFPDGTSSNYSLTSGITNLGAGQYQAKYNTKQAGEIREVWSIVGADGTTLASAQFLVGVEY